MSKGCIYKRPGSSLYWCSDYLHGERHRESTETADEAKAQRFLENKLDEVGAAKIGARPFIGPKQRRIKINDLLDSLESDLKLRNKWNARAASNLKPLREYFGNWRAVEVTSDEVAEFIDGMREEEYADATINRHTQAAWPSFQASPQNQQALGRAVHSAALGSGQRTHGLF
jgi:hypothetical protein